MHNYTGCICCTFLHRVFSNVSSSHVPKRMHSHTGCICLTFLHCVLSNVHPKRLPKKMRSCIGCIYLAFLQCAYLNVSSNRLLYMLQSYTGCICLTSYQFLSFFCELLYCHCVYSSQKFQDFHPSLLPTIQVRKRKRDGHSTSALLMYWFFQI